MRICLPITTLFVTALSLEAATVPERKIDLLADPSFKNWVFHLSEKNSVSTKKEEVAVINKGVLQVTGKGFGVSPECSDTAKGYGRFQSHYLAF